VTNGLVEEFLASVMAEFDRIVRNEPDPAVRALLRVARPHFETRARERLTAALFRVVEDREAAVAQHSETVH
jgi:hypothetical protein